MKRTASSFNMDDVNVAFGTVPWLDMPTNLTVADFPWQHVADTPTRENSVSNHAKGYDVYIKHAYGYGRPASEDTFMPKILGKNYEFKITHDGPFNSMDSAQQWVMEIINRLP